MQKIDLKKELKHLYQPSAKGVVEVKRKKALDAVGKLRLESFAEGRCAQILHIGPFAEEGPTVARLHDFIDARSARVGKHHEIYLSDIRRADPKKWKTIIRQPMALVGVCR